MFAVMLTMKQIGMYYLCLTLGKKIKGYCDIFFCTQINVLVLFSLSP